MRISVIGCGRWGSFITWYLCRAGHDLTLYGRSGSANMDRFMRERKNDYLTLPESVVLTHSLAEALESEIIVISIASQQLDSLCACMAQAGVHGKTFVLCMKGLETGTGRRLSQITQSHFDGSCHVAVWLGPGHVQEFVRGIPNCMVIDSEHEETKRRLIELFSGDLIRFYYGSDLIGNEIGAAAKNVIGIAAGMLDGYGLGTLKGALMSRGTREVARLIRALGGSELSAYGLCHLGDYEATVFSGHSHNRRFGELYTRGKCFDKLAEGYYTAQAMHLLAGDAGVELPICETVYSILYGNADAQRALDALFRRSLKQEFQDPI